MFKRTLAILVAAIGLLAFAPVASAASVAITKSKFKYNGVSYFRGKSENVNFASFGQKKTPAGKPNYLAVQGDINRDHLEKVKVKISGPYAIDWSKYSSSDVNVGIKYLTAAGGTASFSRDTARSAKLVLLKMSIDEGPLKTLLNNHANSARNFLADEGGDARVVSEVWIVVEATLGETLSSCGSVSGKGTSGGIQVKISGNTCKTTKTSVTIPANTTFAYGMHKVKKWNKGKTKVEDLEDDQKGFE